jgi:hypothetical protein
MTMEDEPMAAEERRGVPAESGDDVLDGNAVGGDLAMVFGVDATTIPGACSHCGTVSVIAELRAYTRAPGTVLRCPACSDVVLRVVRTPTAILVDVSGAAWLQFERG